MSRFDVSLCFVPQETESGIDFVPEDAFVVALGDAAAFVDHVVSRATPRRVGSDIASSINTASDFTYENHVIVGTSENIRDKVVKVILRSLCHEDGNAKDKKDIPQQCMIFALDKTSVVCKIFEGEDIHSVIDVVREMESVVLVALKYERKTSTIIVVNRFSITILACFLGPARCHVWLLVGGSESIENSVTMVHEALAVLDALGRFCSAAPPNALEVSSVRALLNARAASDAEAKLLAEWLEHNIQGEEFLHGVAETETITTNNRLSDENAVLRTTCEELRVRLAEVEEQLSSELDAAGRENARLRQSISEAERSGGNVEALERRVLDLEAQLAAHDGELRYREEVEELKLKLGEAQTLVHSLEQKFSELAEENMRNVVEFQQREIEWQTLVRHAVDECQQLRDIITTQGSSIDTVKEAVMAEQALQDEELDELLMKIRAISAANPLACHRRVSPRVSVIMQSDDTRRRPSARVLSPVPLASGSGHV